MEKLVQNAMQSDLRLIGSMKKLIIYVLGLLMLSCAEKVIEKPQNLIPKDKMVGIYHDLALYNAAKNNIEPMMDYKDISIMEHLYEKYGVDSVQLAASDLYYASVPLEYEEIYEKVEAILMEKKSSLELKNQRRNDSIRQIRLDKQEADRAGTTTKKEVSED